MSTKSIGCKVCSLMQNKNAASYIKNRQTAQIAKIAIGYIYTNTRTPLLTNYLVLIFIYIKGFFIANFVIY